VRPDRGAGGSSTSLEPVHSDLLPCSLATRYFAHLDLVFAPVFVCSSARLLVCSSARLIVCSSDRLLVCSSARLLVYSSARLLVCASARLFPHFARFTPQAGP
jgi:hypothetical protein